MISVIIPTLLGREQWLEHCLSAFSLNSVAPLELIVVPEGGSWGEACRIGARRAQGTHLLFFSDDMEICPGWERATSVCARGSLPAPLVVYPDGEVQSCGAWEPKELLPDGAEAPWLTLPLLSRAQYKKLGPMAPIHYADAALSDKAHELGVKIEVCHAFRVIHYNAEEGRRSHVLAERELERWRGHGKDAWH